MHSIIRVYTPQCWLHRSSVTCSTNTTPDDVHPASRLTAIFGWFQVSLVVVFNYGLRQHQFSF